MPELASVGQTLYQLDPTCQELDWIKQHAQGLFDKKKAFKVASTLGLLWRIEAREQCIARKRHELPASHGHDTAHIRVNHRLRRRRTLLPSPCRSS